MYETDLCAGWGAQSLGNYNVLFRFYFLPDFSGPASHIYTVLPISQGHTESLSSSYMDPSYPGSPLNFCLVLHLPQRVQQLQTSRAVVLPICFQPNLLLSLKMLLDLDVCPPLPFESKPTGRHGQSPLISIVLPTELWS